jgi:hypothetical protein
MTNSRMDTPSIKIICKGKLAPKRLAIRPTMLPTVNHILTRETVATSIPRNTIAKISQTSHN